MTTQQKQYFIASKSLQMNTKAYHIYEFQNRNGHRILIRVFNVYESVSITCVNDVRIFIKGT